MTKKIITVTMKTIALLLLGLLIMFQSNGNSLSLPLTIGANLFIFFLFICSDLILEQKPRLLKGIQLYISVMLLIIAVFEMHHIISLVCVLSIALLPRLINELL